jgi:hypothetical protein
MRSFVICNYQHILPRFSDKGYWDGRTCNTHGEMRNTHRILVGISEEKRSLGRYMHKWENNIKINLKIVGYDDVDWIKLVRYSGQLQSLLKAVISLQVPLNVENLFTTWAIVCLKRWSISWRQFMIVCIQHTFLICKYVRMANFL